MRKSHTTFSRLTSDTFNLHKMHGDGVIRVGQISVIGTDIVIPSYAVQYNGIIVEETTPQTVAFTAADNYICVHGIDAAETSIPSVDALAVPLGVVLLERVGDTDGWRSAEPLVTPHDVHKRAFRRIVDGANLYLSFGADTTGTTKNIAIDSLDQLPFDDETVGEAVVNAGSTPFAPGFGVIKTCKNATIYDDGVDLFVQYDPDIVGVAPLQVLGIVPDLVSICAIGERQFAYAYYQVAVPNTVVANSWTAGNLVPDAPDTIITLPFDPVDFDILSGSEIVAQDALGIIIQATFNSVGVLSSIRNGVTRDTFFVNNGHLSFTDTLGDVYLDWVYVKPAYSAASFALSNGTEIVEIDSIVGYWTAIHNGVKTVITGVDMFAAYFSFGKHLAVATAGMFGSGRLVLYNTETYTASAEYTVPPGIFPAAIFYVEDNLGYYDGTDRITLDLAYTSYGETVEPTTSVQDQAWVRYGKKELHLRQSRAGSLFVGPFTDLRTNEAVLGNTNVGYYANMGFGVTPATNFTVINTGASDGDYFLLSSGLTRAYACDDVDGVQRSVVPVVTADVMAERFSGDIHIEGGFYVNMVINCVNSVVTGATITTLTIEHCRNVLFVGCDIAAYTDVVDPVNNTYKFIGCTIGGVPANTFQALTDTPMAYTPAQDEGRLVVVNATPDALEFTAAARINAGLFEFDRVDYVDGVDQVAYDSPSPMDIHAHTGDPTGFENLTDSVISYDPATRTLTLTPVGSFAFWRNGVRYEYTAPVIFPPHAADSGTHFFYFDDSPMPAAATSPLFWDLSKYVPVSYVQYNAALADGYANEERHGMCMDWATHRHLHLTVGAFAESGFGLGDVLSPAIPWASNASNKITVDLGIVADEDLENSNGGHLAANPYTFMYRAGATGIWTWIRTSLGGTTYPYSISGGWITYNDGTWGLTIAGHNTFVNSFVFATNSIDSDFEIVVVPGQALHASISAAKEETVVSLAFGDKPFQEWVPLYRLTYQAQNGWDAAAGRARIVDYVRLTGTSSIALSASVSYHGALGGLSAPNSHPATAISYDNQLETQTVQTTVQGAVDELYNINVDEASYTLAGASYDAITIAPDYTTFTGANDIVSCIVDIVGTVVEVTYGGIVPGLKAALKDAFHRTITFSALIDAGVVTSILAQDETIYYEHAVFGDARLDPLTRLGNALYDYVELATDGTVTVRGINFSGGPDTSTVRYAARFSYNKVSHVP